MYVGELCVEIMHVYVWYRDFPKNCVQDTEDMDSRKESSMLSKFEH